MGRKPGFEKESWTRANALALQRRRENKARYVELLGGACQCGVNDIRVLHFDHIDPKRKRFDIASKLSLLDQSEVLKELQGCQLFCANCHAIKTAESRDSGFRAERELDLVCQGCGREFKNARKRRYCTALCRNDEKIVRQGYRASRRELRQSALQTS